MGREIRRVPPNWEHPKRSKYDFRTMREEESYQPLYNWSYTEQMNEWIEGHRKWERGEHDDQKDEEIRTKYPRYADWHGGPPDSTYYRPEWKPEEMTWFQVYETVSEGTPVTPPFATREELVDYLVENGDFWDQRRRAEGRSVMNCEPWSRKQAEAFVFGCGWAPSLVFTPKTGLVSGVEAIVALQSE